MRWLAMLLILVCGTAGAAAGDFTVLCYHEVRDDVRDYPDPYAVDSAALVAQFSWLRGNGYVPVSLEAIVAARRGGKPLPDKAVLLSFDDAYLSFYARVYPLLREFRFPALLGVVGKWINEPRSAGTMYGEKGSVAEASFPTWRQLREMAASGLVELASHTYDLHHGVPANPQGNLQPAATARVYDAVTGSYEGDASWRARVRADLARNSDVIERETGQRPRAVVWPYGSYNDELVRMAGELGMPIALTLEDGVNAPDVPLTALRRTLIERNPILAEYATEVRGPLYPDPVRVVQVDLADVYNADPVQQERNLSMLLDRIEVLKASHVFLRATADANGDGVVDAAYFPTRHLQMRADLFNRAAWQLGTRVDAKVYAVMPVTALRLPLERVAEIYEDLARHASFDGLVFENGAIDETTLLAARARAFRAPLRTVGRPRSAQEMPAFMVAYDYVALEATPPRDEAADPDPAARHKRVFIISSTDAPAHRMRALQLGGALNFGYTPDDFARDHPALSEVAPAMSLRVHPLPLQKGER